MKSGIWKLKITAEEIIVAMEQWSGVINHSDQPVLFGYFANIISL
jgi:hypothetical protein